MAGVLGLALIAAVIGLLIHLLPRPREPQNRRSNQRTADSGLVSSITNSQATPTTGANQQNAAREKQGAESQYLGGWVTKENAPDWIMAIITFGGLLAAIRQINEAKRAVLLTERADVLLEAIGISPPTNPMTLSKMSVVKCSIKNFGPTRASDVLISTFRLTIEGEPDHDNNPLPVTVIAAGDNITPSFSFLGRMFKDEAILQASKGNKKLRFELAYTYRDVFGQRHSAEFTGEYYGLTRGGFVVERTKG